MLATMDLVPEYLGDLEENQTAPDMVRKLLQISTNPIFFQN